MSLVKALSSMFVVLGLGLSEATPAQAASTWSRPVEPPSGCSSSIIAANAAGAVITAGYFQSGTGLEAFSVEVCTSSNGVTWTGPTVIGLGVAPAVALAPNGRAVVVWQGGPATSPNVQASVMPPGGVWSAPVIVSNQPGHPTIGMDGAGNAIAVWSAPTQSGPVETASLPAGGSWTAPVSLAAFSAGSDLATNAVGGVVVGWRTGNVIEVASGTVLGGPGAPVKLGLTYGHSIHPAHAALNSAGDASFIWETDTSIFISTRTPEGAWAAPTQLASVPGEVGTAIDGAGNAIAAFSIDQGGAVPTYASRRSAGGTWGAPTLVSASNDRGLGNVAGDAAGTFVIAWTNSAGAVEALTIPPGGSFGPGTVVGAGPFSALLVLPGGAVLSIGAGLSKETVQ
jgi:hypothetical protein